MYTQAALTDIHTRCHWTLRRFMTHCKTLTADELHKPFDGFGYPTVQSQIHHIISAQRYWLSVIEDRMSADEDESAFPTIDVLEQFRASVFDATEAYLSSTTEETLNTSREMLVWGGTRPSLVPALVVLRTQTHIYQHVGQIVAMCKLCGKPPAPGSDFPLKNAADLASG